MSWTALHTAFFMALLSVSLFASVGRADPMAFFPSVQMHEDDRQSGAFELRADGCQFELTQRDIASDGTVRKTVSVFDLSRYVTDPQAGEYPIWPYTNPRLTSRYTAVWRLREARQEEAAHLNLILMEARLGWGERRDLGSEVALEKRDRLEALHAQLEAGELGQFAAHNHVEVYRTFEAEAVLVSLYGSGSINLPVYPSRADALVSAMDEYRRMHCPLY